MQLMLFNITGAEWKYRVEEPKWDLFTLVPSGISHTFGDGPWCLAQWDRPSFGWPPAPAWGWWTCAMHLIWGLENSCVLGRFPRELEVVALKKKKKVFGSQLIISAPKMIRKLKDVSVGFEGIQLAQYFPSTISFWSSLQKMLSNFLSLLTSITLPGRKSLFK